MNSLCVIFPDPNNILERNVDQVAILFLTHRKVSVRDRFDGVGVQMIRLFGVHTDFFANISFEYVFHDLASLDVVQVSEQ